MAVIDRGLERIARFLGGAGILVALLMALHIVIDVAARFLFNAPLAGTLEIVANYYMVGLIFAPLALVQRKRAHIAADFLAGVFGRRLRTGLDVVIAVAMTAFCGAVIWRTGIEALRSIDTLEAVQTSGYFVYVFPARWFIPVGLTAMGCCALAQGIGSFRQLLRGEVEADS
jgi:TRAP-type C4-dicarboxylate transport system permease small subunit